MKFMKSLKTIALLLLIAVIGHVSVALAHDTKGSDAKVYVRQIKTEQKQVIIAITHMTTDKASIMKIKDKKGAILHEEVIRHHQDYAGKYDLSDLPDGHYSVEVKTPEGIVSEDFNLVGSSANATAFSPTVQIQSKKIRVVFYNPIASPVIVTLFDHVGKAVYQEEIPSQQSFGKILNVSLLKTQNYTLAVAGSDYYFSQDLQVR